MVKSLEIECSTVALELSLNCQCIYMIKPRLEERVMRVREGTADSFSWSAGGTCSASFPCLRVTRPSEAAAQHHYILQA